MVDLIKGLGKIQVNGICILAFEEILQNGVHMFQEVGEAVTAFLESMLVFTYQKVLLEVLYYGCSDYALEGFHNV